MNSAHGLISAENIAKNYGKGDVLKDVSLGVLRGERIGIVGRNGGGKSTLLRILVGAEAPDAGRVSFLNGLSLGYLAQVDTFEPERQSLAQYLARAQRTPGLVTPEHVRSSKGYLVRINQKRSIVLLKVYLVVSEDESHSQSYWWEIMM